MINQGNIDGDRHARRITFSHFFRRNAQDEVSHELLVLFLQLSVTVREHAHDAVCQLAQWVQRMNACTQSGDAGSTTSVRWMEELHAYVYRPGLGLCLDIELHHHSPERRHPSRQ